MVQLSIGSYQTSFTNCTLSLLGVQHERDGEEKKRSSSLVTPWEMPVRGTHVLDPSCLPAVVAQFNQTVANKQELKRITRICRHVSIKLKKIIYHILSNGKL